MITPISSIGKGAFPQGFQLDANDPIKRTGLRQVDENPSVTNSTNIGLTTTRWLYIIYAMVDLHKIRPRRHASILTELLQMHPVVILHGARQTGKTTLARGIDQDRAYRTFDDLNVADLARRDPGALFIGHDRITLDEVQREPDILQAIKIDVDHQRAPGRFLLTGSANLLLMHKISESLAGRAIYLHLPTLTWAEIERRSFGEFLHLALNSPSITHLLKHIPSTPAPPHRVLSDAIFAGGYPVPALSDQASFRTQWFDGYIQTYLERDLRDLSSTDNLIDFRRLMQISALHNGNILNVAAIANDVGLPPTTAGRYLNLLETSFQIARIPAFAVNRGKRLIKSPKLFWTDTGLAAHLAGFFTKAALIESREWGRWLENWMGIHLHAYAALRTPRCTLSHWRTSNGHEVDFILEQGTKRLPIEIKATGNPSRKDLKGLETFLKTYPDIPFGIVACQCESPQILASNILSLPISHLLLS